MAPVIREFEKRDGFEPIVILTGQHRDLARQALGWFNVTIDHDLDVMSPDQSLSDLSSRLFAGFGRLWTDLAPQLAIVQGDTTSAVVAAMSAFYRQIPVAHVEAGLRTHDAHSPFPEEMNRVLIGRIANLHFAPTGKSRDNLLRENIGAENIVVTGNTVIDALSYMTSHPAVSDYPHNPSAKLVLVTIHRRENMGRPLESICRALRALHESCPDVEFVLPVHPNPNISGPVRAALTGLDRIHLTAPLDYPTLADLMKRARFLLTDSGGLQEEGPALGKPVLILRNETERAEIIDAGVGLLVGHDPCRIVQEATRLLRDDDHFNAMANGGSPFGDGRSAPRIVDRCIGYLNSADQTPTNRLLLN